MEYFFFFFFQAEDGIRDYKVTGVQTCALPICTYTVRISAVRPAASPRRRIGSVLVKGVAVRSTSSAPSSATSAAPAASVQDRKSTRLNSSHLVISYAVFCLKKKKNHAALPQHN